MVVALEDVSQSAHTLQEMIRGNHGNGLPHYLRYDHKCSFCVTGKQERAPFPSSKEFKASKPLKLVFVDLFSPIISSTFEGGRYLLLIFEKNFRLIWVAILKNKPDALKTFKKYKTLIESESK